jgi:hypothetical protein
MWHHFSHLLQRSWETLVSATGTTTLGFVLWTLAITAISWIAAVAGTWVQLKRAKQSIHPWREALSSSVWTGLFLVVGISVLVTVAYGVFVVRTVYTDHLNWVASTKNLLLENRALKSKLIDLQTSLDAANSRKPVVVQAQDLPLRITTQEYGSWAMSNNDKPGKAYFIMGITNKTITPIRVTMTCDHDLLKFDAGFLIARKWPGLSVQQLKQTQVDARTYEYERVSPAWTPEFPLGFGIFTESTKGIDCKIFQRP